MVGFRKQTIVAGEETNYFQSGADLSLTKIFAGIADENTQRA